jgi:hypothetical protein
MSKRKSAYIQGLNEEQRRIELEQNDASTKNMDAKPETVNEAKLAEKTQVNKKNDKEVLNKTTLYFTTPQLEKFDELIAEYKRFTNIKLKRSDIAQILIERVTIQDLLPIVVPKVKTVLGQK